ncbi:MAG TPA: ABC transporter substrate-binding protein [Chloroflexota bacterium]|nr:ABC transporter substrate-binding protein [Chloroflexota bacterium]
MRHRHPRFLGAGWLAILLVVAACAPAAAPAPAQPSKPGGSQAAGVAAGAGAPPASAPAAPAAAAPTSAPAAPSAAPAAQAPLLTTPRVAVKMGTSPVSAYGPFFIAQERGYFSELGLDVELVNTTNTQEQVPALTQGQLHVGSCGATLGCLNALSRRTDLKIVAGMVGSGKTEKSTGQNSLVVRKDLWDSGAVREAKDLAGHTVYLIAGEGSSAHSLLVHWLRRNGVDPSAVPVDRMPYPDQLVAITNGAIDAGIQAQPVLSTGLERGVTHLLATQEEMNSDGQTLFMMYWGGIDRLVPQVGERIMVGYLKGVRDYMNAFEYGVDQDAIIDIMVKETTLKDPAVYRRIPYGWTDPNGLLRRASVESDAQLFYELGLLREPVDLSQAYDDQYRQAAVRYLGEYQPPR